MLRAWKTAFVIGIGLAAAPPAQAQLTGACCVNGGCQVLSEGTCDVRGGVYIGAPNCANGATFCRLIRCCLPDAACAIISLYECLYVRPDAVFYTEGSDCPPDACPLTGACCREYYQCRATSEFFCVTVNGGEYQGDYTTCADNICDRPEACCEDGSCRDLFADECRAEGGRPGGFHTDCLTHYCPDPGDIDRDMDQDLSDYQLIQWCFHGPGSYAECIYEDLDHDGDVDLYDIHLFLDRFTGE